MNIPYVMKKCTKCGRWLVANTVNFSRTKNGRYGLNSQCKECNKKYRKQYYEANREKELERAKQYRENNKEKIVEINKLYREANKQKEAKRHKRYYENNKDSFAEYGKQYRENNKKKIADYHKQYNQTPQGQVVAFNKRQRRRTKEQEQGSGITKEQWLELMSFFDWKCAYSGETLTDKTRSVDHIVPLNSNGDNAIWNLVPMTRLLNSSKNTKDMEKWYKEQECYDPKRLAKIYEWQEYARKKWEK